MFIGEYAHTIDEKGRLSIPASFRRKLSKGVVVTRGLDGCLFIYAREAWDELAAKVSALPLASKQSRAFARLMLAGAREADVDSQGRVMVPEYLRQYASLRKHVIVTGLYNRIEVWDEDAWGVYRSAAEQNSEEIAEAMAELGV
ncbi:cell division/cell wall cluster transcriptional repressor MraZ [bacterium]|nr:cell division/cell wall cluster transcriptional repressor MraZ [bacterium]